MSKQDCPNNSNANQINYPHLDKENAHLIDNNNFLDSYEIKSDAYPTGVPDFISKNPKTYTKYISDFHKISKNFKVSMNMVYFQILSKKHLQDIIILHREWFPVMYSISYLENYISNIGSSIAIGAFVRVNEIEYIVGRLIV